MEITEATVVETKVEETDGTRTHFFTVTDEHADRPIHVHVSEAVERVADRPTREIEPLAHCIDPDALEALFGDRWDGRPRATGEVTFPMDDFRVTVIADDRIVVAEPA